MTTQPIVFEDTTLYPVFDPVFDFLLTNREVAKGFGTSIQNIIVAKNRNSDELIEGKHYLRLDTQTNGGVQKVIHWTKRGIVRLGFFIKSERAKKFRDFIEDLTLNKLDEPNCKQPLLLPENLNAMANGYKGQLKRKQNQIEKLKSELAQCRKELEKCKSEHTEIWKEEAITQKKRAEKAEELAEHFRKMAAYQVHKIMIFTEAIEKLESIRSSFTSQLSIYYEITSVVNMLKDYIKKADEYVTYLHIDPIIPKLKYST